MLFAGIVHALDTALVIASNVSSVPFVALNPFANERITGFELPSMLTFNPLAVRKLGFQLESVEPYRTHCRFVPDSINPPTSEIKPNTRFSSLSSFSKQLLVVEPFGVILFGYCLVYAIFTPPNIDTASDAG